MTEDQTRIEHPSVAHETSDVNVRAVLGFGIALLVAAGLIHIVVYLLFAALETREARKSMPVYPLAQGQADRLPPEPRLQEHPEQDLEEMRAEETRVLNSYAWVDEKTGVVRIPIDRAKQLLLKRGLPVRRNVPPPQSSTATPTVEKPR
jgi:hypothetical protein